MIPLQKGLINLSDGIQINQPFFQVMTIMKELVTATFNLIEPFPLTNWEHAEICVTWDINLCIPQGCKTFWSVLIVQDHSN